WALPCLASNMRERITESSNSLMLPFKPSTDSTVYCILRMYCDDCFRGWPILRPVRSRETSLLARSNRVGGGAISHRWIDGCSLGLDRSTRSRVGDRFLGG